MLKKPWRGASTFMTIQKAGILIRGVRVMITGIIQQRKKEPV